MSKKKRPFKRPVGESELGSAFGTNWNNMHSGFSGPVTCGACGTTHPDIGDDTYTVSRFLGMVIVEECCGALLDRVYRESGEEFALRILEEFAENPADPRFYILRSTLLKTLLKARSNLDESLGQVKEAGDKIIAIQNKVF